MAAGRLDVNLSLGTADFVSGLSRAEYEADKFRTKMVAIGSAIGTFLGQFAVEGAKQFARNMKAMVSELDDLSEVAQGLQMTAVELSNYRIAAEEAGVGAEKFDMAIGKLNAKIADAVAGNREGVRLFKALGISIKDAAGNARPATAVLSDLADRFQRMEQGPAKAALAYQLFGEKVGRQMVTYLSQGSSGLQKFSGLTEETVKAAETMQAEFDKFNASLTNVKNTILGGVIPALNELNELSKNTAKGGAGEAGFELPVGLMQAMGGAVGLPGKDASALQAFTRGQEQYNRALAEGLKLSGAEAMEAALKGTVNAQKILDSLTDGGKKTKEQIDFNTQAFAKFVEGLSAGLEKTEALSHVQEATLAIEQKRFGELIPQQKELLLLLAQQLDMQKEYAARVAHNATLDAAGNAERERFQKNIDNLTGRGALKEQEQAIRDLDLAFETGQINFVQHMIGMSEAGALATSSIEKTNEAAEQFALTMSSSLGTFIEQGGGVRDFFDSLMQNILKLTTQLLITKPLMEGLTEGFGGASAKSEGGKQIAGWIGAAGELLKGWVGSFAAGTDYVPADGLAMVHRGERIVTAAENRSGTGRAMTIVNNWPQGTTTETASQAGAAFARKLNTWNTRNN